MQAKFQALSTIVLLGFGLMGCAGQPSAVTSQSLYNAQSACAQGDRNACAYVPSLQYQANVEAQRDADAKTALAAVAGAVAVGAVVAADGCCYYGHHWHHHYYGW